VFATWDDLNARPGDCITEGARLDLVRPAPPPPMMSLTLRPKSSHDRERLAKAVTQLLSMDTSLLATTDDITGALILSGIGEGHLRRAIRRLESLSGAPVEAHLPAVGYRESPRQSVLDVEGIHRRMSDGCVAEFGSCRLSIVPDHDSLGNSYIDRSTDEEVPKRFRGSIDEGVQSGMRHGPTAGYPVIGAAVSLSGGDYNMLQSTEDHFRLAGTNAVKNALEQSGTFLLEPWCRVDILTPCELGNVLSDISSNRGRVLGLEVEGKNTHVQASYPYRELRTFASRLNSLTYGRGKFTYGVSHYERLPSDQVAEVIKCSPFRPKALNSFQTARGAK
jgi:elongation factor G